MPIIPLFAQTNTDQKLGGNKFDQRARQARDHEFTPLDCILPWSTTTPTTCTCTCLMLQMQMSC